ncbi:protein adenylyltransferase SelO [Methyloprofundus sp.]|uniref:protein adenylyltransferase SelO n=1 Tax=Methyloprofundus sp. TaxID=2020875 RepID=UPI003D0E0085
MQHKLDHLQFDNRFVDELPADKTTGEHPRQVEDACYSAVIPTPVCGPQLVAYSKEVAALFDLSEAECQSDYFTQVFSGNQLTIGMQPYAMCYGGHQFGHWAGQLGDGRAINLGEVRNQKGERWAMQLKGAGLTPYSRTADGLAVLRSSVREFLCSEAMYHLGVPTTRALSLVTTGEQVVRDMFYSGNPQLEKGAVVCRVAPSFIRFGSFEIHAARQNVALLRELVDYTIRTDFPHLGEPSVATYQNWFNEVCAKTAEMIVHWQRVGFVHGVMNTDNMSILGLTIDYGPYGWLENYDPDWTPNTTDREQRRYRFGNQPQIAAWNLNQLANAIYPLIEQVEPLQNALNLYSKNFVDSYQNMLNEKLGILVFEPETDKKLQDDLLKILVLTETDMTIFYRKLANISTEIALSDEQLIAELLEAYYKPEQLSAGIKTQIIKWLREYIARVQQDKTDDVRRKEAMNAINPKYVLRNYLAQLAIDKAEQGDNSMVNELLEVLRHPYDELPEYQTWAEKRPDWARTKAGCSMLSCSS